jgi:hypothetical protein
MQPNDDPIEQWLRTEGIARYDAFRRNPAAVKPAAEVFANLRKHHERRLSDESEAQSN